MIVASPATSKEALENIFDYAESKLTLPTRIVFDTLMQRERLGSTGIGGRISVPHAVFAKPVHGLAIIKGLNNAIDLDSHDKSPWTSF